MTDTITTEVRTQSASYVAAANKIAKLLWPDSPSGQEIYRELMIEGYVSDLDGQTDTP